MTQVVHVCLSGSLSCSGLVPCEECLKEHELRVLPRLARMAGFNGSIEQWRSVLEGHRQGWGAMQQALYEDPTLRARMHVRDVSEAQRTAPAIAIDAPPPQAPPPQPRAWGGSSPWGAPPPQTQPPTHWGAPPGYPPPGYTAPPAQAHAPPPAVEPAAEQHPPQVVGQVVHGQPPQTAAPEAPKGLGYDPMSTTLSPDHLADIMSRARQTGPARVVRRAGAPKAAGQSVGQSADPQISRPADPPPITEQDILQAAVPVDPATPGSTNGAPPR